IQHIDVDDYYWLPTDPPFTIKRPPEDRVKLIQESLGNDGWVLTGSFDGWGDVLIHNVDLIVFVDTATSIRMDRLISREKKRHGDRILPGGDMFEIHIAFREWASKYDDPDFSGRNRSRHHEWLSHQNAPVLQLDGASPVSDLSVTVLNKLKEIIKKHT
ncbi:adenylate kinase, partial [Brucellaceae bacterium C25G]